MKTSLGKARLKNGVRRVIQKWRSRAMSMRPHSLAIRLFFMAETKLAEKAPE